MINIKDGMKEFGCAKHGIDYRICCEECGEKWAKFTKVSDAIIEDNNQDEETCLACASSPEPEHDLSHEVDRV